MTAITPAMIKAAMPMMGAVYRFGQADYYIDLDEHLRLIYGAMESARREGEEAARQDRMKAREVAR